MIHALTFKTTLMNKWDAMLASKGEGKSPLNIVENYKTVNPEGSNSTD
jgi:hypothetical protein